MARKRRVYNVISEKVQTHKVVSRTSILENQDTKSYHIVKEEQIFTQEGTEKTDVASQNSIVPNVLSSTSIKIEQLKMPNTYFRASISGQKGKLENNYTLQKQLSSSETSLKGKHETSSLFFENPFPDAVTEDQFLESCPPFQVSKTRPLKNSEV